MYMFQEVQNIFGTFILISSTCFTYKQILDLQRLEVDTATNSDLAYLLLKDDLSRQVW